GFVDSLIAKQRHDSFEFPGGRPRYGWHGLDDDVRIAADSLLYSPNNVLLIRGAITVRRHDLDPNAADRFLNYLAFPNTGLIGKDTVESHHSTTIASDNYILQPADDFS